MEGNEAFPRMVAADIPDRGRMYYLANNQLDFIAEVKEFLDWKMATKRAPATIKAYCFRLSWYYRFLAQKNLDVLETTPADLTEFVIWLCHPYRDVQAITPIYQQSRLTATSCERYTNRGSVALCVIDELKPHAVLAIGEDQTLLVHTFGVY